MASVKENYAKELERRILEARYVPGDEKVEVTASDIELAHRSMRSRLRSDQLLASQIALPYVLAGVMAGIVGIVTLLILDGLGGWPVWLAFVGMLGALCGIFLQIMLEFRMRRRASWDVFSERTSEMQQKEALYLRANLSALEREVQREGRPTMETQRMLVEQIARLAEAIRYLERRQSGGRGS